MERRCFADWSTHGSSTGGYFSCNIFDTKCVQAPLLSRPPPPIYPIPCMFPPSPPHSPHPLLIPVPCSLCPCTLTPLLARHSVSSLGCVAPWLVSPRGKLGQLDGEAKGAYEARLLSEAAKAKVERLNFFVQRHLNSLRAASIARAGTLPERCTVARTVRVCVQGRHYLPVDWVLCGLRGSVWRWCDVPRLVAWALGSALRHRLR